MRDQLGLVAGHELEIRARDGMLEVEPVPTPVTLVRRGKAIVAKPRSALPALTQDAVRDTLERTRQ